MRRRIATPPPMIPDYEQLMAEAVHVLGIAIVEAFLTEFDWPVPLEDQPLCIAVLALMVREKRLHMFDAPEGLQ
jgi:hypothetical protein